MSPLCVGPDTYASERLKHFQSAANPTKGEIERGGLWNG